MSNSLHKRNIIVDTIAISLLYAAAWLSINESYLSIVLYAIIPIAFVLSSISYGNPFRNNRYMIILLIMYGWIGLTYFGALYVEEAQEQMKRILGVIIMCSICANMSKNERNIPWLYGVYIVYYIAIIRFAQKNVLDEIIIYEERLDHEKLNANELAYFTFYTTIAIFMLGEFIKYSTIRRAFRILFFATIVLSFFIAMLTASRQVLIVQIPLFVIFILLRYASKIKTLLLVLALLIGATFVLSDSVQQLYDGSILQERNELSVEEDERTLVMQEAVQCGIEHPVFGVGPGNFVKYSVHNVFSHCTYTELWANSGIIAVVLYIVMLLSFIVIQWKRYRQYRQYPYLIFCIFGIFFVVDNFFYVFYSGLWLMSFFILVASHSEVYHKNQIRTQIMG